MTCQGCLQPKTHRVTEGGITESFCKNCPHLQPINQLLHLQQQPQHLDACPVCKTKRAGVKKTGLVGCPVCYEVFDDNIRDILGQN